MAVRAQQTVAFAVRGPIERADLPGLCDRVCRLLARSGASRVVCDVRGVGPDAVTADALARLQLAARRRGCRVTLCNASDELRALLAFMGLTDVVPDCGLRLEPGGQAEQREDPVGIEEESELDDPPV